MNVILKSVSVNLLKQFQSQQFVLRNSSRYSRVKGLCASYELNSIGLNHFQNKIKDELTKPEPQIRLDELREIIYLSKTDADLKLAAQALEKYRLKNRIDYNTPQSFNTDPVINFMEVIKLLDKPESAIQIYKQHPILFNLHRALETFYELLYNNKKYSELIELFSQHLNKYTKYTNSPDDSRKQRHLSIPISHLNYLTCAAIQLNTKESLETLASVLRQLYNTSEDVSLLIKQNYGCYLRLLYLAILQNDEKIVNDIISLRMFDKTSFLAENLRLIGLAFSGKHNEVIDSLKRNFRKKTPLLLFTLKTIRSKFNASNDEEMKNVIDIYYKKAVLEDRVLEIDLPDVILNQFKVSDTLNIDSLFLPEITEAKPDSPPEPVTEPKAPIKTNNNGQRKNNKDKRAFELN